jgi:hypothetical protein
MVEAPPNADIVGGRGQLVNAECGNVAFWNLA